MTEKQLIYFTIDAIRSAGIEVITDKAEMDAILGEPIDDAYTSATLQKCVITYTEGERAPDLAPREITLKNSQGKDTSMYTVQFYGDRPKDYIPKTIGKAYKLMEQWPDGTLHALFAGTDKAYPLGIWDWAKGFSHDEIKGMQLAPRYGWHMGTGVPSAPHLMGVGDITNPKPGYYSKSSSGHPKGSKRVWVEVSFDATRDYTDIAEKNPSKSEKDIRGLVPFGGYYMFQESNLSNWIVASSIKLERIIPEEKRQEIMREAGYDEYVEWYDRVLRPKVKAQTTRNMRDMLKQFSKNGRYAKKGNLEIARGGYDLDFQISSSGIPIISCIDGKLMLDAHTSCSLTANLVRVIKEEYPDIVFSEDVQTEINYRKNKITKRKLSAAEIGKNREEIRKGLMLNPEWLERESEKFLTTTKGKVLGFVKEESIYLDPDNMRLETPIHEYTHLWDRMCQRENPELWAEGMKLMKQTKIWDKVKNSPDYTDIAHDDNLIASEVHARLTGAMGAELLRSNEPKTLVKKLTAWNKKFWQGIQKSFAKITGRKSIVRLDAEKFVKAPLGDMLAGKNITKGNAR